MESCVSEERAQHGPTEDAPPGEDAPSGNPSEEDAPPRKDSPSGEDAPHGENANAPPGEDGPMEDVPPGKDATPGKGASSEEHAPPRKVARSEEDAPPRKVARSEEDAPPRKVARSEEDTPPRKVARSEEDAPPRKTARSEEDEHMEDAPSEEHAPPGDDAPSGENGNAPPGEFDESEAEGDIDPNCVVESDHSSSPSSCPDLHTEDGEKEHGEREWTSKSGILWLPTNAETPGYVPSGKRLTPGPTRYAISMIDDLDSVFDLFLTPEIINIIVNMTNLNGKYAKVPKWKDVDVTAMKAYIGLLILAGVYRSEGEPYSSLWEDQFGRAIFRATMSLTKFNLINTTLRFEDEKNRSGRLRKDKLAPIRVIWDLWTQRLPLLFNPGEDVCVDEQYVPFRGKCEFKQYIRKYQARYGLKMWVAADVATLYAWKCQIYTGKDVDDTGHLSQGERAVLKLTEKLQRVTVTCDNVFTTYSLVQELLKRKVAMVGAIKKNKPELPPKLMLQREKAIYSSVFAFNKTTTAVSYIPKRWKNLVVLSSKHRDGAVDNDDKKKPVIVTDYNRCKGAVHKFDQAITIYSCRRKASHWPQALFFNMIDVSAFNSFVIYTAANPNWNSDKTNRRRLFLEELGKKLVSGEMMRRERIPCAPTAAIIVKEMRGFEESEAAPITDLSGDGSKKRRGWCWMCPKRSKKVENCCIKCAKQICKEHRVLCCWSCWISGTVS